MVFNPNMLQHPEAMDFVKFVEAVEYAWSKGHPDIPLYSLGSESFDEKNRPCITYHVHNRENDRSTPKPIKIEHRLVSLDQELLDGSTEESEMVLEMHRTAFDNQIIFTMHVPIDKGAGGVADLLAEEFERFMIEHTPLLMKLGARNLRYLKRFHDDNLSQEMSQNTVKRFIAYTLYTERVTATPIDQLQKLETEIRVKLNLDGVDRSIDSIHSIVDNQGPRVFLVIPPGTAGAQILEPTVEIS